MQDWHDVAALDEVWEGAALPALVGEREIALYKLDGQVFATDLMCTHGAARLCDGFVEGHEVECPLHQGRFDIRSGAPTCAPATAPLATHEVRLDGARVLVALRR